MRNIILEKIVRLFLKIMLLFALFLLIRGHNQPGGGFIAAIIASTGFVFYALIYGTKKISKIIYLSTQQWMGVGMLLILISSIWPFLYSKDLQTGLWIPQDFPILGAFHLGTPMLFDTGVFIAVTGVILTIIISIMEVLEWN